MQDRERREARHGRLRLRNVRVWSIELAGRWWVWDTGRDQAVVKGQREANELSARGSAVRNGAQAPPRREQAGQGGRGRRGAVCTLTSAGAQTAAEAGGPKRAWRPCPC